jgi:hypothetical protein
MLSFSILLHPFCSRKKDRLEFLLRKRNFRLRGSPSGFSSRRRQIGGVVLQPNKRREEAETRHVRERFVIVSLFEAGGGGGGSCNIKV